MILHPHFDVNAEGHLTIGGMDTVELAKQYGLETDQRELAVRSEAFAIRMGGRSARVAKQFIELCKAGVPY